MIQIILTYNLLPPIVYWLNICFENITKDKRETCQHKVMQIKE